MLQAHHVAAHPRLGAPNHLPALGGQPTSGDQTPRQVRGFGKAACGGGVGGTSLGAGGCLAALVWRLLLVLLLLLLLLFLFLLLWRVQFCGHIDSMLCCAVALLLIPLVLRGQLVPVVVLLRLLLVLKHMLLVDMLLLRRLLLLLLLLLSLHGLHQVEMHTHPGRLLHGRVEPRRHWRAPQRPHQPALLLLQECLVL